MKIIRNSYKYKLFIELVGMEKSVLRDLYESQNQLEEFVVEDKQ